MSTAERLAAELVSTETQQVSTALPTSPPHSTHQEKKKKKKRQLSQKNSKKSKKIAQKGFYWESLCIKQHLDNKGNCLKVKARLQRID